MGDLDKPLVQLRGKPLIEWVFELAKPQVADLLLSANRHGERYSFLNLPIVSDYTSEVSGPLIGIVSAMREISQSDPNKTNAELLACFPADVPHFPGNIVQLLEQELNESETDIVLASHDQQVQPLFSIWRVSLLSELMDAVAEGLYGPKMVLPKLRHRIVDVTDVAIESDSPLPFFTNINTPADLEAAQKLFNSID